MSPYVLETREAKSMRVQDEAIEPGTVIAVNESDEAEATGGALGSSGAICLN